VTSQCDEGHEPADRSAGLGLGGQIGGGVQDVQAVAGQLVGGQVGTHLASVNVGQRGAANSRSRSGAVIGL